MRMHRMVRSGAAGEQDAGVAARAVQAVGDLRRPTASSGAWWLHEATNRKPPGATSGAARRAIRP